MNTLIKALIWIYAFLILFEGAMRKWIFPGQSEMLLIVRDPVLLLIYALAIAKGTFPSNKFIIAIGILTIASIFSSLIGGCNNFIVISYGIRINYLHLPLIWIIAHHFERRDVEQLGAFFLICAIPIALLMIQQFRSDPNDWINKGVGMDEGGQIFGAEGRIRPPGPFAFITGPQIFLPFCTAFLLGQLNLKKRLKLPLLIAAGCAVLIALPISISRTAMMGAAIVGATYMAGTLLTGGNAAKLIKPLIIVAVIAVLASQLPVFSDGMRVFGTRWTEAASTSDGDGWADITTRTIQTLTNPIEYAIDAPTFGYGIGMGSNVASRLTQGNMSFMLAEEEYAKIYLELGFLVGSAFIFLRIALCSHLLIEAWHSLRREKQVLPLVLLSSVAVSVLFGQWAPPTILGFTVLGSGLILAACKPQVSEPILADAPEPQAPVESPEPSKNRLASTSKSRRSTKAIP